jgi:nucleoid-associated protein YgaU
MAVDVKIGLLLSLVFVFVLVFVLNSVPHSGNREGSSDPAAVVVADPPGIGPGIPPEALLPKPVSPAPAEKPAAPQTQERFRTSLPEIAAPEETAKPAESASPGAAGENKDVKPAEPAPQGVRYIVCDGDSLAYIAQKFYGPVQGNKRENVMKIFEANRGILKSPDQIDVGQELVIPPLGASQPQKNPQQSILSGSMFEKVESIGRKRL